MRIKGIDLRKIIREEITRSMHARAKILKEAGGMGVGKSKIEMAAKLASYGGSRKDPFGGGTIVYQTSTRSDLDQYLSNWGKCESFLKKVIPLIPEVKNTGGIISGYYTFAKMGMQSPLASEILRIIEDNTTDVTKAVRIMMTFQLGQPANHALGQPDRVRAPHHEDYFGLLNFNTFSGAPDQDIMNKFVMELDRLVMPSVDDFLIAVEEMATYDVVGETEAQLGRSDAAAEEIRRRP